jgi:CelD/BcsL family acetyltransferase involved in cellulose biosynthesis
VTESACILNGQCEQADHAKADPGPELPIVAHALKTGEHPPRGAGSSAALSNVAGNCDCRAECDVLCRAQLTENLREPWDCLVERCGGPVYMTFDWVRTWWDFYGGRNVLRVLLYRSGESWVGVLPLYVQTFGFGPIKARVARLVGANIPPKVFNPPVDPGYARKIFAHALEHLFVVERCDLISLGPVSQEWAPGSALAESCAGAGTLVAAAAHVPWDVQTRFRLPSSFEEYLAGLSPGERKSRLKRLRHLEKQSKVTSDVVGDPSGVSVEFERFVDQHTRQWQAVGKTGHFRAWPRGLEFHRAAVQAQARLGRVRFFRMLADGKVVCNRYAYLFGGTLHSELPSREVGEPWDRLGIGAVSLLKFNESAIHEGVDVVDSGLGAYEHKTQLGGEQVQVGIWRISGRGVRRLRAACLLAVARAVMFLFHKVWYRRLSPMTPSSAKTGQGLWWLWYDL